jgi:hypothetical protein
VPHDGRRCAAASHNTAAGPVSPRQAGPAPPLTRRVRSDKLDDAIGIHDALLDAQHAVQTRDEHLVEGLLADKLGAALRAQRDLGGGSMGALQRHDVLAVRGQRVLCVLEVLWHERRQRLERRYGGRHAGGRWWWRTGSGEHGQTRPRRLAARAA